MEGEHVGGLPQRGEQDAHQDVARRIDQHEVVLVIGLEVAETDHRRLVAVHGEGGSGGALGLAIGDRILMHEFAIYSVIPPEGCAAILWRDAARKVEAAEALRLTAPDLQTFGVIDEIVAEPVGGAHTDHERAATLLDAALDRALKGVWAMEPSERLDARYRKFRAMGNIGINES